MKTMEELEALREQLLRRVRARPASVRETPGPGDGAWTPTQVLQHLYLVEALLLDGLASGRPLPGNRRGRSLREHLGAVAVHLVFRLGLRVRMPTRRVNPDPPLPFPELEARWAPVALELRARLEEAQASAPGEPVMHHPVAGPMVPETATRFLLDHMRHHETQLERILGPRLRGSSS